MTARAGQEGIRRGVVHEPFGLRVQRQPRPERSLLLLQIPAVAGQVLAERVEPPGQKWFGVATVTASISFEAIRSRTSLKPRTGCPSALAFSTF